MGTNESLETVLMQVAEKQVKHFLGKLETLKEGDLKSLEEQGRETVNTMGCLMMESTLKMRIQEERSSNKHVGKCGHPMR